MVNDPPACIAMHWMLLTLHIRAKTLRIVTETLCIVAETQDDTIFLLASFAAQSTIISLVLIGH